MMVKVTNGAVGGQMTRPDPDAAGLDQDLEALDNIWAGDVLVYIIVKVSRRVIYMLSCQKGGHESPYF